MKDREFNKQTIILFLLAFTSLIVNAQKIEKQETITKEFVVGSNPKIEFENRNDDLKIITWDENKVKYQAFISIKGTKEEDVEMTLDALNNISITELGGNLTINTKFYTKYLNWQPSLKKDHIRIVLEKGGTVKLNELKINYVLTIPKSSNLVLKNKYSNVNLADLNGEINAQIYSGKLVGENISGNLTLNLKYSSAELSSAGNCEFDIYDSKIEIEKIGDLNLKSKYSEINIQNIGSVKMDVYDDKINISHLKSIKGKAKYTTFTLGSFDEGIFDIYDCTLSGQDVQMLYLTGKYTKISFNKVGKLDFPDCYDNKINITYLGDFKSTSKYTSFTIEELGKNFNLSGYDDDVKIAHVLNNFEKITIDGKYLGVELNFEEDSQFKLTANLTYPKLEYPEEKIREVRYHKENSKLEYKGLANNASETVESIVNFENYDSRIVLKFDN